MAFSEPSAPALEAHIGQKRTSGGVCQGSNKLLNDESMRTWRGVPEGVRALWQIAFSGSDPGPSLQARCPICGAKALRRFYSPPRPSPLTRDGFVGRGSSWEWCAVCKSYEHSSCLVPIWWVPLPIVETRQLTAEPEQLEIQYRSAGLVTAPEDS
jgi:hypothetical protein